MKTKKYDSVNAMLSDLIPEDKDIGERVTEAYEREKLANYLFIMRNRSGLSQTEMAERLGVTQSAVSKMENKADALPFNDVVKYSQALGYSVELAFIKNGRKVDFLGSYFARIQKCVEELQELAGDDPDISRGVMMSFLTFSKSLLEDMLPQLEKKTSSRQKQLAISINQDERDAQPAPKTARGRQAREITG